MTIRDELGAPWVVGRQRQLRMMGASELRMYKADLLGDIIGAPAWAKVDRANVCGCCGQVRRGFRDVSLAGLHNLTIMGNLCMVCWETLGADNWPEKMRAS